MLLQAHGLTQMPQPLLRSDRVSLWKIETAREMHALIWQLEEDSDVMTVLIVNAVIDVLDDGIVNAIGHTWIS